ncbi:MAG: DNA repair protein RecO [Gemmatales bacterium]|nr:DNA repair protein RecO [Gemmatales bacterium]
MPKEALIQPILAPMPTEKATALVLRSIEYRETSCVVTFWTREFGKVRALAKGGRRLRSRFETALDVGNCCDIVLIRKISAGLDLLTEAHLRERFAGLHQSLQAYYTACLIAEILDACAQENDPHPSWFDATLRTLRRLHESEVLNPLLHWELMALQEMGLQPMLEHCVRCRKPLEESPTSEPIAWNAQAGGVLCPHCGRTTASRRTLPAELWHSWRQAIRHSASAIPADISRQLLDLLHEYWSHRLERPLRLAKYLSTAH